MSVWLLLAAYIYLCLSDVKSHVTACTVVKAISVSPHDSLGHHLLTWRPGSGPVWFGDWVDDRLVHTHAKHTHSHIDICTARKGQDIRTWEHTNSYTWTRTWTHTHSHALNAPSESLCAHPNGRWLLLQQESICRKIKGHEIFRHSHHLNISSLK